ncbi:hypothetical protein MTO96_028420 [Rhipicephalus appendiculatus]
MVFTTVSNSTLKLSADGVSHRVLPSPVSDSTLERLRQRCTARGRLPPGDCETARAGRTVVAVVELH